MYQATGTGYKKTKYPSYYKNNRDNIQYRAHSNKFLKVNNYINDFKKPCQILIAYKKLWLMKFNSEKNSTESIDS